MWKLLNFLHAVWHHVYHSILGHVSQYYKPHHLQVHLYCLKNSIFFNLCMMLALEVVCYQKHQYIHIYCYYCSFLSFSRRTDIISTKQLLTLCLYKWFLTEWLTKTITGFFKTTHPGKVTEFPCVSSSSLPPSYPLLLSPALILLLPLSLFSLLSSSVVTSSIATISKKPQRNLTQVIWW